MSQAGRARGRARGRGKAPAAAPAPTPGLAAAAAAGGDRRPGEQPMPPRQPPPQQQQEASMPVPGRGRSRGGPTLPGPGAPQQQRREDLTGQMAQMAIGAAGAAGIGGAVQERRPRRDDVIIEPSTRPENFVKKGVTGSRVGLVGNCFRLKMMPDWQLHQYRVDFEPNILNARARFALMAVHRDKLGKEFTLDMDTMYSRNRLPEQVTILTSERQRSGELVNIKVTHVSVLNPMAPNTLHLFNVIFRKVLKKIKMEQIGRHYYDPNRHIPIDQHGLDLWPGFITSILQYESSVMLLADISHKVLRTQTVLQVMYDTMQRSRGNFVEEVKKALIGEIVLTRYNNKTYRIDDIDFDVHPNHTFTTRQGDISYIDYFKKTYDRTIEDRDQPMIVSRPKKREEKKGVGPVYLPPELCHLTGLSDEIRSDFRVMRDLAQYTRVAPAQRSNTLRKFVGDLSQNQEVTSFLADWGLEFERDLVHFDGRVLPPEMISTGGDKFSYKADSADWSRSVRGRLNNPVVLDHWTIYYTSRDANVGQDFIQTMQRVGGAMGMRVQPPKTVVLATDRMETYTTAIKSERKPDSKILVIILPGNRKDRYDAIKKVCCATDPIPSQVVLAKTLKKQGQLMSVVSKVAMQMNCKMGGDLWTLEIPMSKLMIIGIDTYHDSLQRGQSVFAFVASMNKDHTRYYSQCSFQSSRAEMGDALTRHMTAALKQYHAVNGFVPDRVIVFRDGVGDSQMGMVVDYEVAQITSAMDNFYPDGHQHKLAVVVVKKRINNRFFLRQNNQMANPPPGTVIDDVVTKRHLYDYFIISQSVRQGTVSPTSYNVVYDRTGLKPDHMQRLTYKLTHLYFNWAGTVRVPAPCMYAHKLAFLIGQSVHVVPHISLQDKLFYL